MSLPWKSSARWLLCAATALLMSGCVIEEPENPEIRPEYLASQEDGPAFVEQEVSTTDKCNSCSFPRSFQPSDAKFIGNNGSTGGGTDFGTGGGNTGLPARDNWVVRAPPPPDVMQRCQSRAALPASCEQIRQNLPGTLPTEQQIEQCTKDALQQVGNEVGECRQVLFYSLAVYLHGVLRPLYLAMPNEVLERLLRSELALSGGGTPAAQMVSNLMTRAGANMVWDNNSLLSQDIRATNQLVGPNGPFEKSVAELRALVNSNAGCPDWQQLGNSALTTNALSPLTNFPITAALGTPEFRLQGPLGGTQQLRGRLISWSVNETTRTVSGTLQFVVGDDFAVSDDDVYSGGLLAFWILQHNRGFRPFSNQVQVNYPFSFQYTNACIRCPSATPYFNTATGVCEKPKARFTANGLAFPTADGSTPAIVGTKCVRPFDPQVANNVSLTGTLDVSKYNVSIQSMDFLLDGTTISSYSAGSATGPTSRTLQSQPFGVDIPPGTHTLRINAVLKDPSLSPFASNRFESFTESFEVKIKPCPECTTPGEVYNPDTGRCEPPQQCPGYNSQGRDTPETRTVNLFKTSGTFQFQRNHYTVKDRMQVFYEGRQLHDTGCTGGSQTINLPYSGTSTLVTVKVTPNCAGTTGTVWDFTVLCPP
jgi:hypothetical protein